MLLELAKPVALLLCLLSLYALFHTIFMVPAGNTPALSDSELHAKLLDTATLLALSAAISVVSGLIFREPVESPHRKRQPPTPLFKTLPLQLFYWSTGIMLIVFLVAWFLETNVIPYRAINYPH